jgi:hypothetical protein
LGKPWYDYLKGQVTKYLADRDNALDYQQQINELHKKMYQAAVPQLHHWQIKPIDSCTLE